MSTLQFEPRIPVVIKVFWSPIFSGGVTQAAIRYIPCYARLSYRSHKLPLMNVFVAFLASRLQAR